MFGIILFLKYYYSKLASYEANLCQKDLLSEVILFGVPPKELTKNLKISQNSARLEISPPHRRNCRVLLDPNLSDTSSLT